MAVLFLLRYIFHICTFVASLAFYFLPIDSFKLNFAHQSHHVGKAYGKSSDWQQVWNKCYLHLHSIEKLQVRFRCVWLSHSTLAPGGVLPRPLPNPNPWRSSGLDLCSEIVYKLQYPMHTAAWIMLRLWENNVLFLFLFFGFLKERKETGTPRKLISSILLTSMICDNQNLSQTLPGVLKKRELSLGESC